MTTLPFPLTEVVGRDSETASVIDLVRSDRLVTLTGVGGTGKTRLALHVAHMVVADREVVFVDLSEAGAGATVVGTIARQIGCATTHTRALDAIAGRLGDRDVLLLLDNCEHVVADAASVVTELLRRTSRVGILATSRERLGVPGEVLYRVPPLAVPPSTVSDVRGFASVQLFLDCSRRAGAVIDGGTTDVDVVAEICRQLDGLPLAVELAAAWARALPLDAIASGLSRRSGVLEDRLRAGPARHQSVAACLEWSHELLTSRERVAFRRLAVCASPFDLTRAATLVDVEDLGAQAWLPVLVGLVDKSLLSPAGEHRFRFLVTVRAFAREQLHASGEGHLMRDRHRGAVMADAATVYPVAWQGGEAARTLAPRVDDLVAAFDWSETVADADAMCRLSLPLMAVLRRMDWWHVERIAGRVAAVFPAAASPLPRAQVIAAWSAWGAGWHPPVPMACAMEAAELFETCNDRASHALALVAASQARDREAADDATALVLAERAVAVAREADDHVVLTTALLALASAQELDSGDAAVATVREAIDEAASDADLQANVRWELVQLLARQGDHRRAAPESETLLAAGAGWRPDVMLHRGLVTSHAGDAEAVAYQAMIWRQVLGTRRPRRALDVLDSCIHLIQGIENHVGGELHAAARHYAEARQWLHDGAGIIGTRQAHYAYHWISVWDLWCQLGLSDFDAAAAVAHDLAARPFDGPIEFDHRPLVAAVEARHQGDLHRAGQQAGALLARATPARRYDLIATATELLAGIVARDNPRQAARLLGAAEAVRRDTGSLLRLAPVARWHQDDVERLQGVLGASFHAATAEGERLGVDEIASYVRSGRVRRTRATHGWDSVTPAEQDVVRLVAAGLNNQEIAARLVVSPRTVASHLRRIFTKLGVRSRTDLARLALTARDEDVD